MKRGMTMRAIRKEHWIRALALAVVAVIAAAGNELHAGPHAVGIGVNNTFNPDLTRSADVGWTRLDIVWSDINPQPGVFNFGGTDSQINYAVSQGVQILGHLSHVPDYLGGGSNHNVPPLELNEWTDFVNRVAQRYRGKVAAYEIWNEPDLYDTGTEGVGWKRDINQYPTWIDFAHAAAVQIRAQAPGTLVVGPAMAGRNNASHQSYRKQAIYQQIEAASYPEGPGPSFVDVISLHNTAAADEGPGTMANILLNENLGYLQHYGPSLWRKPIWITEFGWRTNAVGFNVQRTNICRYLRLLTGSWNAAQTQLDQWDIEKGFIYKLYDNPATESYVIFAPNRIPNPVVTQYLQLLGFPAIQNTVVDDNTYPSCN
jgi:hypothetical protein